MSNDERNHGERIASLEGLLSGKLEAIHSDIREIKQIEPRVRALEDLTNKAKGGWAILAIISTAWGALGAYIIKAVTIFQNTPPRQP